jgi:hypothetical protein
VCSCVCPRLSLYVRDTNLLSSYSSSNRFFFSSFLFHSQAFQPALRDAFLLYPIFASLSLNLREEEEPNEKKESQRSFTCEACVHHGGVFSWQGSRRAYRLPFQQRRAITTPNSVRETSWTDSYGFSSPTATDYHSGRC